MEENITLQELWALPINMEPLDYDFFGYKLYSSDKLKLKFFEAVLTTPWGKYHAKNIQRLVKQNKIVPVIMNKNIGGFLIKKFLTKDWTKNVQGLFNPTLNKVIVFIDNNSSWLGLSSNKELVKTTLHECMHLSASDNMKGFFKIMELTFKKYYGGYFSDIFECQNIKVNKILKALYDMEGKYSQSLHNAYMKNLQDATRSKSNLDEDEYNNIFSDVFMISKAFPTNPNLLMRYYSRFYHIFGPLNTAYMKTFGERNSYTSPSQEIWALSEVASVMVELSPVDQRVSKVLSNIK